MSLLRIHSSCFISNPNNYKYSGCQTKEDEKRNGKIGWGEKKGNTVERRDCFSHILKQIVYL